MCRLRFTTEAQRHREGGKEQEYEQVQVQGSIESNGVQRRVEACNGARRHPFQDFPRRALRAKRDLRSDWVGFAVQCREYARNLLKARFGLRDPPCPHLPSRLVSGEGESATEFLAE
jgi:hypothetical protein